MLKARGLVAPISKVQVCAECHVYFVLMYYCIAINFGGLKIWQIPPQTPKF